MPGVVSHLSLAEFHRRYDGVKPNHEYWFGEAVAKPLATFCHGALQFAIMLLLRKLGWKVALEVTLKLAPDVEPIPDVIATRHKIDQPYPTKPFELCIEVLSPEDRLANTIRKAGYYVGWGMQDVWIIDPVARTAWIVNAEKRDGKWIHPNEALTADGDTAIPLTELFDEVDRSL